MITSYKINNMKWLPNAINGNGFQVGICIILWATGRGFDLRLRQAFAPRLLLLSLGTFVHVSLMFVEVCVSPRDKDKIP